MLIEPVVISDTAGSRAGRDRSPRKADCQMACSGGGRSLNCPLVLKNTFQTEEPMRIDVYGKADCARCKSTKAKIGHYLAKWGIADRVAVQFVDMDTADGMAMGAFNDVGQIPVTIVYDDQDQKLARWDETVPPSGELAEALDVEVEA